MKWLNIVHIVSILAIPDVCFQQHATDRHLLQVMFWNTENFFDPFGDTTINDNEFLPGSLKGWTYKKFQIKRNHIYQVIAAAGGWEPPDIIGLAEIENYFVLYDLVTNTPLVKYNYQIVHKNSPDPRGIDVAMLYRKDRFSLLGKKYFPVFDQEGKIERTREILYVWGITGTDTLHVFFNHWPSRSGGKINSDSKRCLVGKTLKSKTDSLFHRNPKANILIAGDFNDEPFDKSLTHCLGAKTDTVAIRSNFLYNLSALVNPSGKIRGTHKYQGHWAILDQIIVSGSLLQNKHKSGVHVSTPTIFAPDFLLERDERWMGNKPYRTYNGMQYLGGYSDHLPVLIWFIRN